MEGKIKVKVKFGKLKNCIEGKSKERALELVTEDAKTRLRNAYPQVENIEVETKMCRYISYNGTETIGIRASASGYIPKRNKSQPNKPHKYFIKDITSTKLYQCITEKMNMEYPKLFCRTTDKIDNDNITVVAYEIRYVKMSNSNHYVEFSGKGDIPWKQLKDAINAHNQDKLNTGARKKDLFIINPNELNIDFKLAKGHWDGNIILSDGSWIDITLSLSKAEQTYYNTIERHCPPKLDIPDTNFEVTFHKGD